MNNILEKFWLVVAIIATVFTTVIGFTDGFKESRVFFLLCGVTWGIYLIRRGLRKRLEKLQNTPLDKKK
jgi:hypothetical protein